MRELVIRPNEASQRLDKYLHKYLDLAGSGFLHKMLRKKNITLNGKKAEGNEHLNEGDVIRLFLAEETIDGFRSAAGTSAPAGHPNAHKKEEPIKRSPLFDKIRILYEDDDILVVDKPAGILSQKAEPSDYSLNEWLIDYLFDSGKLTKEQFETFHPSVCNRLDRNTSGIVICGVSLAGLQAMSELLRSRDLHKFYRTFGFGTMTKPVLAEGYVEKNTRTNQVVITREKRSEQSSYIKTGVQPLRQLNGLTYLEIELFTGKTHQIRAQLAALGHPIVGDSKYGNSAKNRKYISYGIRHQLLHAYRLEFPEMEGRFAHISRKVIIAKEPPIYGRLLNEE